ncbi:MAG: hypothetical protein Q4F29_01210 [Lachnospiraceae bacterium]|nr:hypothetical protein [Lachnospiraceae bacterium]
MKRKLFVVSSILLAAVVLLSGCSDLGDYLGKYAADYSGVTGKNVRVIFEEPGEMVEPEEVKTGEEAESGDAGPESADYVNELSSLAEIRVKKVKGGHAVCEIEAPDVYSMVMEFAEQGMTFEDEEQLHQAIMEYVEEPECPKREQTVKVPVVKRDGSWYADTKSEEYQDAVTGGLYTAMNEMAQKMLEEMIGQMEEKQ